MKLSFGKSIIIFTGLVLLPSFGFAQTTPIRETLTLKKGILPDFNVYSCDYSLIALKTNRFAGSSTGMSGGSSSIDVTESEYFKKSLDSLRRQAITETVTTSTGVSTTTNRVSVSSTLPLSKAESDVLASVFLLDIYTGGTCKLEIQLDRIAPTTSTSQNRILFSCESSVERVDGGVNASSFSIALDLAKFNLVRKCG